MGEALSTVDRTLLPSGDFLQCGFLISKRLMLSDVPLVLLFPERVRVAFELIDELDEWAQNPNPPMHAHTTTAISTIAKTFLYLSCSTPLTNLETELFPADTE
jgi:hypothetical protein